jgi:hypothetical protein
MEKALLPRDEWEQDSMKRAIRNIFKEVFPKRNCVTLVRPVNDERLLRNIEDLDYDQLRVEFREELGSLLGMIKSQSRVKQVRGKNLTGASFCLFVKHVADCLNSDSFPGLSTINERLCKYERKQAVKKALQQFIELTSEMEEQFPMHESGLGEELEEIRLEVMMNMQSQWIQGNEWKEAVKELKKKLAQVERGLFEKNLSKSREVNTQLLSDIIEKYRKVVQEISRQVDVIEPQVEDLETLDEEDEDVNDIMRQSRASLVGIKDPRIQRSFSRKSSYRQKLVFVYILFTFVNIYVLFIIL